MDPMTWNWAEERAAETKDWRVEGESEEKGPTSLTYTGTEIWKERRWEIRVLRLEVGGERERDFFRVWGREGNESLEESGSMV